MSGSSGICSGRHRLPLDTAVVPRQREFLHICAIIEKLALLHQFFHHRAQVNVSRLSMLP
jgi:hypothetical protein